MSNTSEKRLHPRLPVVVEVELHCPGQPASLVWTEDLSNGGVMLALNGGNAWPQLGSKVQIRVSGLLGGGEEGPLVDAVVVRHTDTGIAVQFDNA